MSRLTELLRQARKADKQLGDDLEKEFAALMKRRTFGLVFEQHQPEAVELPGRAVRRGDKVRVRGVWDGEAEARLIADEIEMPFTVSVRARSSTTIIKPPPSQKAVGRRRRWSAPASSRAVFWQWQ